MRKLVFRPTIVFFNINLNNENNIQSGRSFIDLIIHQRLNFDRMVRRFLIHFVVFRIVVVCFVIL